MVEPQARAFEASLAVRNNDAVDLLRQSQDERAVTMLRTALRDVLSLMTRNDSRKDWCESHSDCLPTCSRIRPVPIPPLSSEAEKTSSLSGAVIFNQALQLGDEGASTSTRGFRQNILSAIVLYNLGLSIHRAGWERGQEAVLRAAVEIYGRALSLVHRLEGLGVRPTDNTDLRVLIMALWNNLAHVHCLLFNKEEAGKFLQLLAIVVDSVPRAEYVSSKNGDYTFFYVAVAIYRNTRVICAAAA